jgi:hypothetical protein
MDRGFAALEDGLAVRELARAHDLPCCTFVACWLLQVTGRVPANAPASDWKPWYKLAPDWWAQANVWEADLPFSSLEAAIEACGGGTIEITHEVSDERPAPALTPKCWHVIQRWRGPSGHTYLAYCDEDGETVTIVQSSVAKGYRYNTGTWTGLDGLDVGVATLEPLT